jgi:hypothetical protein
MQWVVADLDSNTLHDVNEVTDEEWTAEDALKQQLFAEADGCTGAVIAVLVAGDLAFYVLQGALRSCAVRDDRWPAFELSMPVDRGAAIIEYVAQKFAV